VQVRYDFKGFEIRESVIYQDFNGKIVNVLGEVGKLYIMVDDGLEIKLKILSFDLIMTNITE
jgi:hypothetical protein